MALIYMKHLVAGEASVKGASHAREGKDCQDASIICPGSAGGNPFVILAIADGHGAPAHDLSGPGAVCAVESAAVVLKRIYLAALADSVPFGKESVYRYIREFFPNQLITEWHTCIEADIGLREPDYLSEINAGHIRRQALYRRYGTTLLACLISPQGIFFAQLGDGNILVVDKAAVSAPHPEDTGLLTNETYSLTSGNQEKLWNFSCLTPDSPSLVFLSTDGLYNCFDSDSQFHVFPRSLWDKLACGEQRQQEAVAQTIPAYLQTASEAGSGDDITVAYSLVQPEFFTCWNPEQKRTVDDL